MSLPNYLLKIKSSGIYRFVWDKSQVPPTAAETLRLVVGYSEKGPFNTPVYIDNVADFITIYGNISKRLERKGIFFHRLAMQALAAGPILALNIKPFDQENVDYISFNPSNIAAVSEDLRNKLDVLNLYDTNRFWALEPDLLPSKVTSEDSQNKYITIASTDTIDASCTIFVRKMVPSSFDVTIRQWYANDSSIEMPAYLEPIQDTMLSDYFAEVYVFKGQFTNELCTGDGTLASYFNKTETGFELKPTVKDAFGDDVDTLDTLADDNNSNFVGYYNGITFPYFKDANGNYISLDVAFNEGYSKHKMIMKLDESLLDSVTTSDEVLDILGYKEPETETVASPIYMRGYTYEALKDSQTGKMMSNMELQNKLFEVLTYKGVRVALTNRVDCEYHYIVDTFNSYVPSEGCKSMLASIAKEKDNAFAILNFPPMSEFTSKDKFKDANYTPARFDIKKIADKKNGFTLVSEVNGASYCGYFTQVIFSDGTLKTTVPSAALVSNNFMEKYGARQPYYIVAGPNYGRIGYDGLVGPDYNYGRTDLDVLEPMGVNAIIYVPRKGTFINSNQTAKQVPVSALSKIHIRELCIYLQDEIENMLQNYQWELNTQVLRDTIKAKADSILENVRANGGVYDFLNVCDETNNTQDIIDNEMIILNTHIEPARGAGKMVQELTLYKTGGMSSIIK